MRHAAWLGLRLAARLLLRRRRISVRVAGVEHIPAHGPVLIAARHYHHLYDGLALLMAIPRPLGFVVAVDWAPDRRTRRLLEMACTAADWPVILRPDALAARRAGRTTAPTAYTAAEIRPYLRRGLRRATGRLAGGSALAIFPEAYPNIDPIYTPKRDASEMLPFRPGLLRIAARAQALTGVPTPIVPVGLTYDLDRTRSIEIQVGSPRYVAERADRQSITRDLEEAVRLSSRSIHPGDGRRN